jgi:hypothetical protein
MLTLTLNDVNFPLIFEYTTSDGINKYHHYSPLNSEKTIKWKPDIGILHRYDHSESNFTVKTGSYIYCKMDIDGREPYLNDLEISYICFKTEKIKEKNFLNLFGCIKKGNDIYTSYFNKHLMTNGDVNFFYDDENDTIKPISFVIHESYRLR